MLKIFSEILTDGLKALKHPVRTFQQVLGASFYRNAAYLVVNSGITLFLGFLFNILIARLYPASEVGLGSALLSVCFFLAYAGTLGFGYSAIRFLPGADDKPGLLNSYFTLSAMAAAAACIIFMAGLVWWSPKLAFLGKQPVFFAVFVIFGIIATLYGLIMQVFVAFRGSGYVMAKGIITSVIKLVMVIVLSGFGVYGIFFAHGIALAAAFFISLFIFLPRLLPHFRLRPVVRWTALRQTLSFSLANYVAEGFYSLHIWVLSLVVLDFFDAETNAYFYMAWTMSTLLLAITTGITYSLFAEGAHAAESVSRNLTRSLKLVLLIVVPAAVLMLVLGDKFLLVYGRDYSARGTELLQLFTLAIIPASLNFLYLGLARIERQLKGLLLVSAGMAVLTIAASYILLPLYGINGIGFAWLGTQIVLLVFTLPRVVRKARRL